MAGTHSGASCRGDLGSWAALGWYRWLSWLAGVFFPEGLIKLNSCEDLPSFKCAFLEGGFVGKYGYWLPDCNSVDCVM